MIEQGQDMVGQPQAWIEACISDCLTCIGGLRQQGGAITTAVALLVDTVRAGGKVLTAGNGGSAADAMHMAEELMGRFRGDRPSLAAVALAADGTALTCIGNDYGFDAVFSRQVEGLGRPGDLLVLFSTSGRAVNLARAVAAARAKHMRVLLILGRDGGPLAGQGDAQIVVAGGQTERIQEAHQLLMHILLEGVERLYTATADYDCGKR